MTFFQRVTFRQAAKTETIRPAGVQQASVRRLPDAPEIAVGTRNENDSDGRFRRTLRTVEDNRLL